MRPCIKETIRVCQLVGRVKDGFRPELDFDRVLRDCQLYLLYFPFPI